MATASAATIIEGAVVRRLIERSWKGLAMSPKVLRFLVALVAISVIAGFGFMYGIAIFAVWQDPGKKLDFPPNYVYVATALAGLVGGVVAMIFNEKLPDDPAGPPGEPATPSATGRAAATTALMAAVNPRDPGNQLFAAVSSVYVICYFFTGVAAIVTWVMVSETAELVENLALISFGLFIAIARSSFQVPAPR